MKIAAVLPVFLHGDGAGLQVLDLMIAGQPVLDHVLVRLARVDGLDGITVVTTSSPVDDPVEGFCRARGIACYRGAEDGAENRLGLVLAAAKSIGVGAGLLVRDDAPLIDPAIMQRVVDLVLMTDGMLDFVGTTLARTYPRGMDVEAFMVAALEDADRRCADPASRRDPAAYLRQNSRLYRLLAVDAEADLARPDLGFDLRSDADLDPIERLVDHFDGRSDIPLREMIAFVDGQA
jgi:spore coat polysaccharide biosynthesis protein SpsF